MIRDGVCGPGVQVPDDVLQQGDDHDPLAAAVLVAEATRPVSRDNQLDCLVIPPEVQDSQLFTEYVCTPPTY